MAHFLFDVPDGDQERAAAFLRAGMWGISRGEKHRDALAPADLVLIHLALPRQEFVGRAELASAAHDWTRAEAEACPGDSLGGVLMGDVEEWDPPVAMSAVLPRIDPDGSNPYVQHNARAGFQSAVVRISAHEYETVVAVREEAASHGRKK